MFLNRFGRSDPLSNSPACIIDSMKPAKPMKRSVPLIYFMFLLLLILLGFAGLFKLLSTLTHWRMLYNLTTPGLLWLQLNAGVIGTVSVIPALVQLINKTGIAQKVMIYTFLWYSALYWIDQLWISADPGTRKGWLPGLIIMMIIWVILWMAVYSPNLSNYFARIDDGQ